MYDRTPISGHTDSDGGGQTAARMRDAPTGYREISETKKEGREAEVVGCGQVWRDTGFSVTRTGVRVVRPSTARAGQRKDSLLLLETRFDACLDLGFGHCHGS